MESIPGGTGQTTESDVNWKRGLLASFAMTSIFFLIVAAVAFGIGPREVFRSVLLVNGLVCATSCAVCAVSLVPIVASRRAKFRFVPMLIMFALLSWALAVSGFCLFAKALETPAKALWWTVGVFAIGFLPVLALVESKTMRWYWSECARTGRLDLEEGFLDFTAPGPESSSTAPVWLRPGPVGVGVVAVGYFAVMAIVRIMDLAADAGDMAGGVLLVLFAGVSLGVLWPQSAGMLIRVVRWERATGRQMLVAPPKDKEGKDEPEADS